MGKTFDVLFPCTTYGRLGTWRIPDTKPMDGSSTQVMEKSKKASVPSTDMESNITEKEAHQQKGSLVALWLIPGVILLLAGVFLATHLTRKRFQR